MFRRKRFVAVQLAAVLLSSSCAVAGDDRPAEPQSPFSQWHLEQGPELEPRQSSPEEDTSECSLEVGGIHRVGDRGNRALFQQGCLVPRADEVQDD